MEDWEKIAKELKSENSSYAATIHNMRLKLNNIQKVVNEAVGPKDT